MSDDHTASRRPLVHIGYPKAGSTWLQRHVWNNESFGFCAPISGLKLRELLVRPSALGFQSHAAKSVIRAALDNSPSALVPVLSEERLVGAAESGGFDTTELARRIKKVLPDPRVLIVVRRQTDVIASAWGQYVKFGGTEPLGLWLEGDIDSFALVPRFNPLFYEFDRLYEFYARLFGHGSVLVVAQEQLRTSPQEVVRAVQTFSGATPKGQLPPIRSENAGLDATVLTLIRRGNQFGRRPYGRQRTSLNPCPVNLAPMRLALRGTASLTRVHPGLARIAKRRLYDEITEYSSGRFEASNRRLELATGLPLGQLGYPL